MVQTTRTKTKKSTNKNTTSKKGKPSAVSQSARKYKGKDVSRMPQVDYSDLLLSLTQTRSISASTFYTLKRKYLGCYKACLLELYDLGYSSEINVLSESDLLASYAHEGIHFSFRGGKVPLVSWLFYLEDKLARGENEFYSLMYRMLSFKEACVAIDSFYDNLRMYNYSSTSRRTFSFGFNYNLSTGYGAVDGRLPSLSKEIYELVVPDKNEVLALPITSPYMTAILKFAKSIKKGFVPSPTGSNVEAFSFPTLKGSKGYLSSLSFKDLAPVLESVLRSDIVLTGKVGKVLDEYLIAQGKGLGHVLEGSESTGDLVSPYVVDSLKEFEEKEGSGLTLGGSSLSVPFIVSQSSLREVALRVFLENFSKQTKFLLLSTLDETLAHVTSVVGNTKYESIKACFLGIDNHNIYLSLPKIESKVATSKSQSNLLKSRTPYQEYVAVGAFVYDIEAQTFLPQVNNLLGMTGDFLSLGSDLIQKGQVNYVGCPVVLIDTDGDAVLYVDSEQVSGMGSQSKVFELGMSYSFGGVDNRSLLNETGSLVNFYLNSMQLVEDGKPLRILKGVYSLEEKLSAITQASAKL